MYLELWLPITLIFLIPIIFMLLFLTHHSIKDKRARERGDIYLNKWFRGNQATTYRNLQTKILRLKISQEQKKDLIFILEQAKDKRTFSTLYNIQIMEQVHRDIKEIEREGKQWRT